MLNFYVRHTKNSYQIEGKTYKVEDALTEDVVAFLGICHAIFICQKRKEYYGTIESNSFLAVKWVKEERVPIENERTRNAIKYLKSIPTLRTINIEYTNGIREY